MRYKLLVMATTIGLTIGSASALDFSNTYFFGDSLTDSGAFVGNDDAGAGGTFSTDPGLVWSEVLANSFGTTAIANNPDNAANTDPNGTNYAQGGARVTLSPGFGQTDSPEAALPVSTQIANYLASNPTADPNAVYSVWAGANDIFFNFSDPAAVANLTTSANELSGLVSQLADAGAKYIIVPNLPDIGTSPSSILTAISSEGDGNANLATALGTAVGILSQTANSPAEQLVIQQQAIAAAEGILGLAADTIVTESAIIADRNTSLADSYNAALSTALSSNSANIIRLDVHTFLAEVMANPAELGLINVTGVACGTPSALPCTSTSLIATGVDSAFLFADGVHPTTAGHQIIAQYALSVLEAPALISSLTEIPFGIVNTHQANAFRQARLANKRVATSDWTFFADAGLSRQDIDATSQTWEGDSKDKHLMLGLTKKINNNWLLGMALQQTKSDVDFASDHGGFKLDDTRFSLFTDYQNNNWFAKAIATVALKSDYDDVERKISLGTGYRVEKGNTEGDGFGLKLAAGLNMLNNKNTQAGPFASLNYQSIDVDGYFEDSDNIDDADASSTAMKFGNQSRDSLLAEIGAFVDTKLSEKFVLHASLSREQELKDDNRSLTSGLRTLGQTFVYDDISVDGGAWKAEIAISTQLNNKVSLGFAYQLRKGDDVASSQSANAVLRVDF